MIFHEQPTAEWVPFDFKLLEAYQILQDEICPVCSNPIWVCRSTTSNVQFKVKSQVCFAEKALKEAEFNRIPKADRPKGEELKREKAEWGRSYYTSPYIPENLEGEIPTRDDYHKELNESVQS